MVAEALFENGGFKVHEGGKTVGFLWVEPAPGLDDGQLQRWVLTKTMGSDEGSARSLTFERWGDTMTLEDWKAAVQRRIPADLPIDQWGSNPALHGLWPVGVASYIVAQSKVVLPQRQEDGSVQFPAEPTFPRGRTSLNTVSNHMGGSTIAGRPHMFPPPSWRPKIPAPTQIVIPLVNIYDAESNLVGICGGECYGTNPTYFQAEELFLLFSAYRSVGTHSRSTWGEQASPGLLFKHLSQTRDHMESVWEEGCRYEVTGCNYYVSDAPPPREFV